MPGFNLYKNCHVLKTNKFNWSNGRRVSALQWRRAVIRTPWSEFTRMSRGRVMFTSGRPKSSPLYLLRPSGLWMRIGEPSGMFFTEGTKMVDRVHIGEVP